MSGTPHLHTPRLDLEPVRAAHAREVWPQLDDENMWRYFPEQRPATLQDLQRQYARWEAGSPRANEVWLNWLCRAWSSGALVGAMQSTVFPDRDIAYVAYAVYAAHQRSGYAREAVQAIIAYVAQTYGVGHFLAEMHVRNEPSYRLAESLGFVRTQTRENEYLYELRLQ